jgi:hypothetical protein
MINRIQRIAAALVAVMFLVSPAVGPAAETKKPDKLKPYPLDTCAVTGEKLGGMGKPYVFAHENREIKLCCKGCLKEFNKNTKQYLQQLAEAEKKPKAK